MERWTEGSGVCVCVCVKPPNVSINTLGDYHTALRSSWSQRSSPFFWLDLLFTVTLLHGMTAYAYSNILFIVYNRMRSSVPG
jgi:hypothetical protein